MRWRRRWATAIDLVVLGLVLPVVALPVGLVAGQGLVAVFSRNDCGDPCEAPAMAGLLVWAALVVVGWVAYRPLLRRFRRRSVGHWVVDRLVPPDESRR